MVKIIYKEEIRIIQKTRKQQIIISGEQYEKNDKLF
jgi:hypothetical protein